MMTWHWSTPSPMHSPSRPEVDCKHMAGNHDFFSPGSFVQVRLLRRPIRERLGLAMALADWLQRQTPASLAVTPFEPLGFWLAVAVDGCAWKCVDDRSMAGRSSPQGLSLVLDAQACPESCARVRSSAAAGVLLFKWQVLQGPPVNVWTRAIRSQVGLKAQD